MFEMWKQNVNSESNDVRTSVQIREFCEWRHKCDCTFLTKDECQNQAYHTPTPLKWL